MAATVDAKLAIKQTLTPVAYYFSRPIRLFREYQRVYIRPDLTAGITVGVILLPQAIAFAVIAELPPVMGLYAAIVGAIAGAFWGSSNHIHTGPTNAISLLVLSSLQTTYQPNTVEYVLAAGLLAVMVGIFQLVLGLLRLGMLVNFVSHSVIVGFASGAGLLIVIKQLRPLFGLQFESHSNFESLVNVVTGIPDSHVATAAIGLGTVLLMVILRRINRKFPAALIAMVLASLAVFLLNLNEEGVAVIGELSRQLPQLAELPLLDLDFISNLSTGALAVGAIGLVETLAIGKSIATQTNQRIDSNQEFVGQGLSNILVGFLSGYPVAGSFSRSAVNFGAGAKTPVSAIISAGAVLIGIFLLAPLAAFLPVAALAGVLVVTGIGMIDREEIMRILRGTRSDALIMVVTFFGTLFLHIEVAVLMGILLSLVAYILRTSAPRVHAVVPDENFKHFLYRPDLPNCPQLGVIELLGDLYFGAVGHVEDAIHALQHKNPDQRFLLIRMHSVDHCDFSGIHMLESVVSAFRDRGGDVFMVQVSHRVMRVMERTGFVDFLGEDHFLNEDKAIGHIFHRVLDPAVCIYECPVRVFRECQNLPKKEYKFPLPVDIAASKEVAPTMEAKTLWQDLRSTDRKDKMLIVDVREPREFHRGHVPGSELMPLPELLDDESKWPQDREIVFVCRSGRRSQKAAQFLQDRGHQNVHCLDGGILAWEAADLLEAVEDLRPVPKKDK